MAEQKQNKLKSMASLSEDVLRKLRQIDQNSLELINSANSNNDRIGKGLRDLERTLRERLAEVQRDKVPV
jgi:hypothetical protein